MKICFIANGRSIHTQRWIRYFGEHHEVHLITYEPMNTTINGVREHLIGSPEQNLYLSFWPRQLKIISLIREIQPDLIHAHYVAKWGFHLLFLPRIPSIVSAWGSDILTLPKINRFFSFFIRLTLQHVDRVYVVSKDLQRHIIQNFNISSNKIFYIPFGIDTNLFSPSSQEKESQEIIVFSNRQFQQCYDIPTLIMGFSIAYKTNSRLRLILKADGPEKSRLQGLVASLGLEDVITFKKLTSYEDVPNDYRGADIFVTTSLSDGTPVSLLEAMASGLPCIATAVGDIPEWIHNGENGVIIPTGDRETLADQILLLAENPSLRREYGMKAREIVVRGADWETLMFTAEEDYKDLIKRFNRKTMHSTDETSL